METEVGRASALRLRIALCVNAETAHRGEHILHDTNCIKAVSWHTFLVNAFHPPFRELHFQHSVVYSDAAETRFVGGALRHSCKQIIVLLQTFNHSIVHGHPRSLTECTVTGLVGHVPDLRIRKIHCDIVIIQNLLADITGIQGGFQTVYRLIDTGNPEIAQICCIHTVFCHINNRNLNFTV